MRGDLLKRAGIRMTLPDASQYGCEQPANPRFVVALGSTEAELKAERSGLLCRINMLGAKPRRVVDTVVAEAVR